jgi:ketosteroid isomerase-like protein
VIDAAAFRGLLEQLAHGWESGDVDEALAAFAPDAVYMEPPDVQLYVGHDQLRPYFAAVRPGTLMRLLHVSFDATTQTGAAEYTFASGPDDPDADHGVAIVEVRDGRIAHWREYQVKGPADRARFLAVEGKEWTWHIGTYP